MRLEVIPGGRSNVRREAHPFRTGILSAPFLRDLAEIMVLIGFKHYQSTDLHGLDSVFRSMDPSVCDRLFQKPRQIPLSFEKLSR